MTTATESFDAVIIGSGLGGLCAAIKLKEAGLDVIVLERADEVGGTWRDNTYPGVAVDTSILSYSLSFAANPGWSRLFAPGRELLAYLKWVADKYDVRGRIRFHRTVTELRYDSGQERWEVSTSGGEKVTARIVVAACGLLSKPMIPPIEGLDEFSGNKIHSAEWRTDVDLRGKRVAVVGTGASAAQVIPAVAEQAGHLTVFQRSPAWVFPRNDRTIGRLEGQLYRALPVALKARRWIRFWQNDRVQFAFERKEGKVLEQQKEWALAHLRNQVTDPELRAKLTPDYLVGCKRRVMSDDYYPALCRGNVTVVNKRVAAATPTALVDAAGSEHPVDVVIFATGFAATEFLPETKVFGIDDRELHDVWSEGARTHLSVTVSGFPNFFLINGPNTGIGAGSAAFTVECQVRYVVGAVRHLRRTGAAAVDLRPEIQDRSYRRLQDRLARSVYGSGCDGWYQQGPTDNIDTIWPGPVLEYWARTKRFDAPLLPAPASSMTATSPLGRTNGGAAASVPLGATMPTHWYFDPAVHARQIETIFRRSWQYAGAAAGLTHDGDRIIRRVGDLPVVLVNDSGVLRGFVNSCRHRFAPVAEQDGCGPALRCDYHGWTYGLDGQLRSGVGLDLEDTLDRGTVSLVPVAVNTLGPLVFVNPDVQATSLAADLPELVPTMAAMGLILSGYRHLRSQRWPLSANWMGLVENGLECTHCPGVHPDFAREFDIEPEWFEQDRCIGHVYRHKSGRPPFTIINVFPNALIWADGETAFAAAVVPDGPDRSVLQSDIWAAYALSDAAATIAADGLDALVLEDIGPVEDQHAGARLGVMSNGRLLPVADRGISAYHRRIAEALERDS